MFVYLELTCPCTHVCLSQSRRRSTGEVKDVRDWAAPPKHPLLAGHFFTRKAKRCSDHLNGKGRYSYYKLDSSTMNTKETLTYTELSMSLW
jgi:hypothetical protein